MSIANNYSKLAYKTISYLATWLPNENYKLGDYGYFKNRYLFRYQGNLKDDFGIKVFTSSRVRREAYIGFHRDVTFEVNPQLKNIINIKFNSKKSCIANFDKLYAVPAKGLNKLGKEVSELIKKKDLNEKVAIITKIMHAEDSAIFLSSKKGGELQVEGPLNFIKSKIKNLGIDIEVKASYNIDHQFTFKAKKTNPFFSVSMHLPEKLRFKESTIRLFKGKHPADSFPTYILNIIVAQYLSGRNKNLLEYSEEMLHKQIEQHKEWFKEEEIDIQNIHESFHELTNTLRNFDDKQVISNIVPFLKRPYLKGALEVANELLKKSVNESPDIFLNLFPKIGQQRENIPPTKFKQLDPTQTISHIITENDDIQWNT